MVVRGEVRVQTRFIGCMGWGLLKNIRGSLVILDL
jgi:hypothetical protein